MNNIFNKKLFLLLMVGIAFIVFKTTAYSEIQNVKIGGNFTVYGVFRHDFSFTDKYKTNNFLPSVTDIWASSSLSNNVSTMLKIMNIRDWGQKIINTGQTSNGDFILDLAYVKIKMPSGYDITIGRQNLKIGEGFVIGSQYNALNASKQLGPLLGSTLGIQKSFDAIKINYVSPLNSKLNIQGFFAKVNENPTTTSANDNDVNLYGLSGLYTSFRWSVEPYIVSINNSENSGPNYVSPDYFNTPGANSTLSTTGVRGTLKVPDIQNLSFNGEYAKQFGTDEQTHYNYEGWAGYVGGKYTFNIPMKPYISARYIIYSGTNNTSTGEINAWQPMYPSDFSNNFGPMGGSTIWALLYGGPDKINGGNAQTPEYSNGYWPGIKIAKISLGIQPLPKLGISASDFNFSLDKKQGASSASVGNEVDISFKYIYSHDIVFETSFSQIYIGNYIKNYLGKGVDTENPWQILAYMNVNF